MAVPPAATAPPRLCPVPAPAATSLLLLAQAASLAATLVVALWRLAVDLPFALLSAAAVGAGVAAPERGGAIFYEGVVRHRRSRPVVHEFSYPVRLALVNLDAPPPWFVASGQAARHMTAAAARAAAAGGPAAAAARIGPASPVWLLTNPDAARYHQNPISVYYVWAADAACCGPAGEEAAAPPPSAPASAVAEVTNTPWAASSSFAFDPTGDAVPKSLHVSPFMDMAATWRLVAAPPGARLALSVGATHPAHGAFFAASLTGARCVGEGASARNERAGVGVLLRYGYMPHRVALWIYAHALLLAIKGVPFYGPPPSGTPRAAVAARDGAASRWRVWAPARAWPWNGAPCGV